MRKKIKESWYARKQIGNYRPPRNHPDVKRDRLNEKGMKKLRRLKDRSDYELYMVVESRLQILAKVVLRAWKWKLSLISPSSKGGVKEVMWWHFIAEERYGRVRHLILQRTAKRYMKQKI